MTETPPPRLYCIAAADAAVVAVFRRGPSAWSHIGRWDLTAGRYEPGAWLNGRVFPRRSDLSPDGRYLCYFAHKPSATWELGEAYVAVSKLPWLTALYAVATMGTWTRGFHFTSEAGEEPGLKLPYGLASNPAVQFATERRRGWVEATNSPRKLDAWDSRRNARLQKPQPGGARTLFVTSVGHAGGEFGVEQAVDGLWVRYWIEDGAELRPLDEAQWADWGADGALLVATRDGRIQRRELGEGGAQEVSFEHDLTAMEPTPVPAPEWAQRW